MLDAVDAFISAPVREVDKPFLIASRTCSTSKVAARSWTGRVEPACSEDGRSRNRRLEGHGQTTATDIEMFRNFWTRRARATTSVFCCAARKKKMLTRGMVLAKPGTLSRTRNSRRKSMF